MTDQPNITAKTYQRPPPDPVETRVPFAFVHINKCGGSSVEIALGIEKMHETAGAMRDSIGAEAWEEAYTFALVRNPFERIVSIYYYRVRTDEGGMADRHLNFNTWVARVWAEHDPRYWEASHLLAPCADWLCEDGRLLVGDVVKLEEIRAEWPRICARLGIDRPLERANHNSHPPYRAICDAAARKLIEDAFAEDLERFGYRY